MKYDPLGSALELIKFGQTLAAEKAPKPPAEKKPSLEQLWVEEMQRRAKFDEFMKMQKKVMADDKKKKEWSVDYIAMMLLSMMPLNWAVMYLLLK